MEQEGFSFETARRTWTVSQLTDEIKTLLESHFGLILVEGEISNLRRPASGHYYFTFKDEGSQINAVMFKTQARLLKFKLEDGQKLLLHARVGVYKQRGEYQLIVEYAEPMGLGALELAFRQLKEKLEKEGLFTRPKKTIPKFPRKVGVVTSETGAAIRDIIRTITRRSRLVDILLMPAKVQGDGAAEEISQAIALLDSPQNPWYPLDVIIIGRGGGSLEDLWAFNEESLARAVADCKTPIISAVGHEIDFVITDFVADERCATPTAAGERVSPLQSEIEYQSATYFNRIVNAEKQLLKGLEYELNNLRRLLPEPTRDIENKIQRLDDLSERLCIRVMENVRLFSLRLDSQRKMLLRTPMKERLGRREEQLEKSFYALLRAVDRNTEIQTQKLENFKAKLTGLNPSAILERGYAIARKMPEGKILRKAEEITEDEQMEITLFKGKILGRVEKVEM